MAGKFVMALFAPETLMESGILAMLGVAVEGSRTESSLVGAAFEMSAAADLRVTLLLVEAPTVELSLSTSVTARSLAMSSSFEVLETSAAASLPTMCFLGEGLAVLFFITSFVSAAFVFFFNFCARIVVFVISNIFQGLHFNWCN